MISKSIVSFILQKQLTYCCLRTASQRCGLVQGKGWHVIKAQLRSLSCSMSIVSKYNYVSSRMDHPSYRSNKTQSFHSSVWNQNNKSDVQLTKDITEIETDTETVECDRQDDNVVAERLAGSDMMSPVTNKKTVSIIRSLIANEVEKESMDEVSNITEDGALIVSEDSNVVESSRAEIEGIERVVIPKLYTLAPLVNESEVLKNLVKLGVDLSVIEQKEMANDIMKMDFETGIKPYLLFLTDVGVSADRLGHVITKNPWIFQQDLENIRVRIDFLRSKKFTREDIVQMIDRQATFLCMKTERIDAKIAFYQREFNLTGNEVRSVVSRLSKLLITNKVIFKDNKFHLKEFLGFTNSELKTMFVSHPKLFISSKGAVAAKFDYLHNVMEIPHSLIVMYPRILRSQKHRIETRHRFLLKCGCAQYDPLKPNYVSLQNLISGPDNSWCVEVAKSSVAEYNQFQKMI